MHRLEEEAEPMHIFIEGGGGVGKTCLGHALMETITRYYRQQVGEDFEHEVILNCCTYRNGCISDEGNKSTQ